MPEYGGMTVGQRIKHARFLAGLTARCVGLLTHRSPAWLIALEHGCDVALRAASLAAIARALGVSAEWLKTGEGEPPTEASIRAALAALESGPGRTT
jgi:transcriptional regulator with XRE-family HTH domain